MKQVDAYIDSLPEDKHELGGMIREIILSEVPGIEERFSYKLPFYHYFGIFCYINSIPGGFDIGFCRGRDLVDAFPQLERRDRAVMASISIFNKKDIERLELRRILSVAAAWNEEAKKLGISVLSKPKKAKVKSKKSKGKSKK